jgi:RNA polymerase sigma factor (sigma-70 family)
MPGVSETGSERRGPGDGGPLTTPGLVEHLFRHEYGRLVAVLVRRVGVQHMEYVEDAVQSAFMAALTAWTERPPPGEPGAWLYNVAHNRLIQELRQQSGRVKILERAAADRSDGADHPVHPVSSNEIRDDMLRMIFVCCDDAIPWESRLVLALKTLCGFSTAEIALRLFTSEANVYKRLGRARDRLRLASPDMDTPPLETLRSRLPGVYGVLYLLFNEGYLSAHADQAIRRELCDEAVRLTTLVAEHPVGAQPECFALLALMHLHAARLGSRVDGVGGLLLLEEQDRSLWDRDQIQLGLAWLARSAGGDVYSRFHAEAGIAAEHCLSPSYHDTRWQEIADLYAMLERVGPSPLHTLNRAVAVAEWRGPDAGLAVLDGLAPPAWLSGSYLWDAVVGDLHRRAGHWDIARQHRERALDSAPTDAVRELLSRRLAALE